MKKFARWSDRTISWALIATAAFLIYVAFFVKNPWVKAGVLAWEILP